MQDKAKAQLIVLTGAGGFIGRRVLAELIRRPVARIIAIGREPLAFDPLMADRVTAVAVPDGDFSRGLPPAEAFALVHCAWCPPGRDSWAPHAEHVALLAKALQAGGDRIERVVALGSAEEYGAKSGKLAEDDAAHELLSPYAWGKRAAQLLVRSWSEKRGRVAFWPRPFTVYGEGQAGGMVIPYAVRQAAARESAQFSDGRQRRDFIHVDDVARGVVEAALVEGAAGYRAVNLGTGRATALCELLAKLARLFDVESLFEFGALPRRPGEPDEQVADTSVAAALLNWRATIGLDEGLARIYRYARH